MPRWISTITCLAPWLAIPGTAPAQSAGDVAAYTALLFTPVGAFAPAPFAPGKLGRQTAFTMRYGNLSSAGLTVHHFAIGAQFPAGASQASVMLGTSSCDRCDGRIMFGVDWRVPVSTKGADVSVHPALGVTRFSGDTHITAF